LLKLNPRDNSVEVLQDISEISTKVTAESYPCLDIDKPSGCPFNAWYANAYTETPVEVRATCKAGCVCHYIVSNDKHFSAYFILM
jgi:hypothetical protein